MTYADFFAEIKGRFMEADVSDIKEHLAYQFNITGEASGIFYVTENCVWNLMNILTGTPCSPAVRRRFGNWRTGRWTRYWHLRFKN